MLFIFFLKEMSWILFFHLLMSQNYIQRNMLYLFYYIMVLETLPDIGNKHSLTIFDDILLEKTAHAQLGHHARKSRKAWENNVQWKKCQSMLFASAVNNFLNLSWY